VGSAHGSAAIRLASDGQLVLPPLAREAELRANVWAHRTAFDCEPQNPLLGAYLARGLRAMAAGDWRPTAATRLDDTPAL